MEIASATLPDLMHDVAFRHAQRTARLDGQSFLIGLIGRGISRSKSPFMHEREGERLGLGYTYMLLDFDELDLADSSLPDALSTAEREGFAGVNVTHPYKQAVLAHLDDLAPEAAAIGAVNTVVFERGRRIGHNTDCWGFAESFRRDMPGCRLGSVLQFGAGGAGAAVAHALLELGVDSLTIADPEEARATSLATRLSERFSRKVVAAMPATALAGADGIVNATPVGMAAYPGTPFDTGELRPAQWVADIVYFPAETDLLRRARALSCRTLAGAGMAVFQAVKAFELFTGIAPDPAAMIRHFEAAA